MTDTISPWIPETNPIRIAVLAKLGEECNELAGRASRCLMQGAGELDPKSGLTNLEELAREMADVIACINTTSFLFATYPDPLRVSAKEQGYVKWHAMIEEASAT
ncbi:MULTISPECIES: hypothetical protein [unclassified Beijerinckia]|uniref:hypothetical protein n=1 Tax=unclassified Beijerinckia TaxID=2638183 RepID=UPI000899689C|nr:MULTISPECIES: hypothetical protein [unclassified Beijerinckia]MDH7796384.1 hypothetical protein [Beijerinckia sp. GAS462]SEC42854.1 hypothetical protein SAMN05443249_2667 [Beijerinckia sp. 28-YEA-48]